MRFFIMQNKIIMIALSIILLTISLPIFSSNSSSPDIRLYTLNCGYLDIHHPDHFASKGFYPHKTLHLVDPCFLIKHPKGWLLWDLGVGDKYVGHETLVKEYDLTIKVPISLEAQLKQLGLQPKDINFVAISHTHFDHTGNCNLFPQAVWLIQRPEYQWLRRNQPHVDVDNNGLMQILKPAHKILLNGNYDLFGDGTVEIISTPGHTPGHQSLKLTLGNKVIILSGDLYHTRQNYLHKQVPQFNTNKKDTLASMKKIENILQKTKGQLIIQHELEDFSQLPKFPSYESSKES